MFDRTSAERQLLDLQSRMMRLTLNERKSTPQPRDWAYGYAGRPREFIGELIGPQWYTDEWLGWRTFIAAVFCQPLASIAEWRIFQKCTRLNEPPKRRPPSVWMPIGRRGGKSRMLAAIAVYLAMCHDWSVYLDPGELGVCPVLAADRRQARTIMSYVKAMLDHPQLRDRVVRDTAETIEIEGNIVIEVVTASYRMVRSRTIIAALCDEIAFWHSDDSSANPDHEIIAALEPAMATIPNALLLGASSPYARRGVLWDQYERWFGQPDGPLVWQADTRTMNPTVPRTFIDEKYEEDATAARAEYGAEFRADVDMFVSKEVLDAVVRRDLHELEPHPELVRYQGFVDPSGGSSDSMTLAIGHVDRATKRGVLDLVRERRPPFSPEAVVEEFVEVCRRYRVFRVVGDFYGGDWPGERFRTKGVLYQVSDKRKSEIYLEFLPLLNAARIELLDNRRLYNQLLGLERRQSRGGFESIDHGPGAHDDLSNVVAGVMVLLMSKKDMLNVDPSFLAKAAAIRTRPSLDNLSMSDRRPGPVWR